MVGGVSVAVELHSLPCLSVVDALPTTTSFTVLCNSLKKKHSHFLRRETMQLSTSFVEWHHNHSHSVNTNFKKHRRHKERTRRLTIFNNLGGQYEETFYDVKKQIVKYFTYKAVRTVLQQLYEMNPPQYRWFYNFVATNDPADGKRFIRTLVKEQHELAERVMVTRLHLYGKWIKKCNHAEIYQEISDQNLELMRERLIETVIWPSDDTNTEKIG